MTDPGRSGPVAVLVNPAAGRGRHRRLLPAVTERLAAAGRPLRQLTARTAATAEAACREAVADGAGALVAIGGDGTLHAALQALAGTGVPFGVVPAGTGNDLAAGFGEACEPNRDRSGEACEPNRRRSGVPTSPLAAADAVAAALREHRSRRLDLALVTGADGAQRWYGGVLAAGFDAIVNERANRMRWPRGDRRYDLAIFIELVRLRPRGYVLELDGVRQRFDGVLVAVGNLASYGGGIRICPDADPTDGLLDVVVGGPMSRVTLARLRPRAYRGTHVDHPLVSVHRARRVWLDSAGIVSYADGERCLPLPVTIAAVPGALAVLA